MDTNDTTIGRRDFLRAGVGAAALSVGATGAVSAATAPGTSGVQVTSQTARASEASATGNATDPAAEFDAWFEGVDNYDGVVDRTGESTVTVTVGAAGNGGAFAYGPAAVRVDSGTTVVWEWTGEGGGHDVAATDGAFQSPMTSTPGATFEHTFGAEGISYYACTPHEALGMRGAIVVGNILVGGGTTDYPEPAYGDWFEGVDNFEGTVDATGVDEVRISVGAADNGGTLAFDPPAIRVDPGTTVVWEWTGDGAHDVVAEDGSYASDVLGDAGSTFALTFDGDGVSKYACTAHGAQGMRGAVVVGAGGATATTVTPLGMLLGGGLGAAILAPFVYGLYYHIVESTGQHRAIEAARHTHRGQVR